MSKGNSNGILILIVERGNEINVEYSKREIINKINSYFGYKLIGDIKLQTFNSHNKTEKKKNIINSSTKKFKDKISEIKNKNIRNSLSELLDVIKND